MDFAKPVKAIALPQDVSSTSDRRLIELKNQVQRLMEAHLAPMQPTQVNKVTTLREICSGPHDTQYCMENPKQAFVDYASSRNNEVAYRQHQQDDMINKVNTLWKIFSKMLDDTSTRDAAENLMTQTNFASTNYLTKEELQGKGIQSPSKLLSPKYLSQSSLAEQSKNPSSPKRVHFINSLIVLSKEDEAKEEDGEKSTATECKGHETTHEMEDEVESKEEVEKETEEEAEEEEEGNPEHFDTFPTMNELRLDPWRKLSNPNKNFNFVGRVRGLKVFVGNFTYKCDFMVPEDTTSVIDHYLGSVVFGKPFVEATGLVYNKEEGTLVFEKDKEKILFKMPHKMNMFKHIDFADISTDRIPPFLIKSDDDNYEKTHYSDNLDLGTEYKHDEYVCRGIRSLMATKARRN
ncbi:hypothetical protein Tco_0098924 [Tanacetum coccineum]